MSEHLIFDARDRDRLWSLLKPLHEARHLQRPPSGCDIYNAALEQTAQGFEEEKARFLAQTDAYLAALQDIHDRSRAVRSAFTPEFPLVDLVTGLPETEE